MKDYKKLIMKKLKVKGLILKKKEVGEANLLITIFSQEYGKLVGMAYGIRKSKKRNIASLNPLNIVEMLITEKNNYHIIDDTETIKVFNNITKNIEKLEIALYILDSVEKIYDLSYENHIFFDKILEILDYIDGIESMTEEYKYYIGVSFLRRIMIEHGIYDKMELKKILGEKLGKVYDNLVKINGKNSSDLKKIQNELKKYSKALKKITYFFEKYININLQVHLEIKKFVVEGI